MSYDYSALDDPAELRRKIQAGPPSIWRYADFLPFDRRPQTGARRGLHAADPLRAARRAPRRGRGLRQERRRQPDPLVQGPGRERRGRQGAGARLRGGRLRLDREPGQRGRRACRGGRPRVLRVRAGRPRGAEDPRDRHLRHEAGRGARQLRRRQPALHRAVRRAPVGVREREPAALLRRGLEDARRSRSPSSSASSCPTTSCARSHRGRCSRRSPAASRNGSSSASWRASLPDLQRRPGRGLQPGRQGVRGRPRRLPARAPEHDRQVAGDREPGRRRVRARRGAQHRRARSTRSPTRRSSTGSSCSRETTGIFTETAGGVTTAVLREARRARRHRRPTTAWCSTSPARA